MLDYHTDSLKEALARLTRNRLPRAAVKYRADRSKAAKILSVHPNTVYSRFQRILDLTGVDPKSYDGLTELLVIADCRGRQLSTVHE